jgi:hypothetical protein
VVWICNILILSCAAWPDFYHYSTLLARKRECCVGSLPERAECRSHTESDARRLIEAALADKKRYKDVQELLQAVYQKNRE